MKIKNKILITGNHDAAFIQFVAEGIDFLGEQNGTTPTIEAWRQLDKEEQFDILEGFFKLQRSYYISNDNIMFVHGGFPRDEKLTEVVDHVFYWDRELVTQAMSCKGDQKLKTIYDFKDIFIGHTPTIYWGKTKPIYSGGVMNVDTGSGKGGPLTIMDVDTKEYWQSDLSEKDRAKLKSYGISTEDKSSKVSEVQEGEEETTTERKAA
jgi:serine/threonine protein phosphatase 1